MISSTRYRISATVPRFTTTPPPQNQHLVDKPLSTTISSALWLLHTIQPYILYTLLYHYLYRYYILWLLCIFRPPPLRPSAYNAAYSAHNPCRRREARYLAFYWMPVKSHRPKPSRAISSVFQYIVLYTLHQPQDIVVDYAQLHNISPCYDKREIRCLSYAVQLPV